MIAQSVMLWPHQVAALQQLDEAIRDGERRICLTSPTGGGKTLMATERIQSSGARSILYTHRKMLLTQTSRRFVEAGLPVGILASGYKPNAEQAIQVAMIQSEAGRQNRGQSHFEAAEVMVDECHLNKACKAVEILNKHAADGASIIGLTATPIGVGHIYSRLIVAGTNSELRRCGAHVPVYHYAPDEPDQKLIGKVNIGEGECGISRPKRMKFAQRVFGRVIEHYHKLNPEGRPTMLFAPGVQESIWFAEQLHRSGISAAHIDGSSCWYNGELTDNCQAIRDEIAEASQAGHLQIVCNRFVLREGVDWPWIGHGIFATVFGSLSAFLQAGGRLIRAHESIDRVTCQDHGGNYWRFGSLNEDREWDLNQTDRIITQLRMKRIREEKEPEPIHCPACNAMRLKGPMCPACGYQGARRGRPVLQTDGTLKHRVYDEFKPRRVALHTNAIEKDWVGKIHGIRRSKKATVTSMTFAQAEATFARDHNWKYPPKTLPLMPKNDIDWFRPVKDVPLERLS